MNNLSNSVKNFLGNKNTVTIIGVVVCIIILYVAYNYRINQQVKLVTVPYANQEIPPKTLITEDMVSKMEVPIAFLRNSEDSKYYENIDNIVGKYSNINATIPAGSIFYDTLLVSAEDLPDAIFKDIKKGYVVTQFNVDLESMYGGSIMPGNIIDIYLRALNDEGKAIFGKFFENIEVLAVKNSSGKDAFSSSEDSVPAYMYVALPEEYFILVGKVNKITTNAMQFMMVPNKVKYADKDSTAVELSSEDLQNLINNKSQMVDSNEVEEIIEENETQDENNAQEENNNNNR